MAYFLWSELYFVALTSVIQINNMIVIYDLCDDSSFFLHANYLQPTTDIN